MWNCLTKTLKTKWLKKVLVCNEVWSHIPESHQIDRIGGYGINFYNKISPHIKKTFWISVVKALESYHVNFSIHNQPELSMHSPIWFNPNINISYVKKWDDKGLKCLGDIFEEHGVVKRREKLSDDFKIIFNFIDYTRLIKSMPNDFILKNIEFDREEMNPWCQEHVLTILGDTKSNQMIKHEFLKRKHHLSIIEKWEAVLLIPEDSGFWNKTFTLLKTCNQDKWMQMFQYKILHRILATNKKLFQYKIIDSPLCNY